jgi:hypothetical protein
MNDKELTKKARQLRADFSYPLTMSEARAIVAAREFNDALPGMKAASTTSEGYVNITHLRPLQVIQLVELIRKGAAS